MPKSAAERKAAQRARQAEIGMKKVEVMLDARELEMLERNCAARRPGREPYDVDEYIATLIRRDNDALKLHIRSISKRRCARCGDTIPVSNCVLAGDSKCWVTRGWHELKFPL